MSLAAIGLVLLAAFFHAGWNALAKRRGDILAFFWLLTVAALALYALPFALLARRHPPAADGLPFAVASSVLHVGYYALLARSYARADLSFAYPIARGTGVLLVPLLALPVFGDAPTAVAWVGIALVVVGIVGLHLPGLKRALARGGLDGVVSGPALGTGLIISCYSLVDSAGVKRIHPLVYLYLTFALIAVWFAPYMLTRRRAALAAELQPGGRRAIVAAGLAVFGTYWLVLTAFRLAPVSYVVPMREVSIVFGALIGVRFLGEPFGHARLGACAVVALGVMAIGIGG